MLKPKPRLVVVSDQLELERFSALAGAELFDLRFTREIDPDWLRAELPEAEVFWSSLRLPLTAEWIAAAPRLKVVVTNSTGTDHLDLGALRERGITLLSLKEDREFLNRITPTAELAFALLLACARRLPECVEATRQGDWARHRLGGNQIGEKTVGIIGMGRLGTMVVGYAKAFRMKVVACDPYVDSMPEGVEKVDFPSLLAVADFISLHVHLNDETRGMIGKAAFAQMKRGVVLINTSRGGLIDEAELIASMEAGIVQAAGLDVIDGEWMEEKRDHPLIAYSRKNPRLLITPHTGGACPEAGEMTSAYSMSKLATFFFK